MDRPPRTRRRWSDHDRHIGRFITYARDTYGKPLGIVIDSGEGESPGCHLRVRGFGHTVLIDLPPIVRPWRRKIVAQSWDAATVQRLGRDWYWDEHGREYGFQYSPDLGFLQVFLGRQTHDSSTTQDWACHLPWTQWRFVRQSWYGPTGQHIETLWETNSKEVRAAQWQWRRDFEKGLVKTHFEIQDDDGTRVIASTHIEEREWRFGTGLFAWLSLFRRPKIVRSLDIEFSSGVGPDKDSWKGGLIGTGIDMLPGELHEAAFRRYCEQDHRSKYRPFRLTFVGAKPAG